MKPPKKRLVLFDIDGTLLRGGPFWKESFLLSFGEHLPNVEFPKVSFGGKTDLQICREMMEEKGFTPEKVEEFMHRIVDSYLNRAEALLPERGHEVTILPGVREVLHKLSEREDVVLGLLTGNVKRGADLKLKAAGLDQFFLFGVYGDDHWDRYKLPSLALKRAKEKFDYDFSGKQIVIIGDTVHDINCGKSIGVRSIAVGTGRGIPVEHLMAANPDYFFKDLSALAEVMDAILEELD